MVKTEGWVAVGFEGPEIFGTQAVKSVLVFVMFVICCSCTPMLENRTVIPECNEFYVEFVNENIDNRLFLRMLKNSLESKFSLIANKNVNVSRPTRCKLLVNMGTTDLPSIVGDSGNINRENQRIIVKYELETKNRKILRDLELLYGTNTSVFKYSNYVKNKKENHSLSETLAEDLFIDVLGQFK